MMPEQFVFPDFKTVYEDAPKFQIQHLKFSLRRLFTRRQVKDFETFVNASAPLRTFFQRRPQDAYPLIHAFVDQRFNRRRRLQVMKEDLLTAEKLFGQETLANMTTRKFHVVLAHLSDGLTLWLNRNDNCVDEGMWSLSLRDSEGKRLYMATFALVDGKLLAASIQGPAGEEAKDLVRSLTKQLHGLRPQQLMVTALQYFSASLNLGGVIGIAQEHQVKLRWRLKKRVKMNYDLFWQENGATLGDDGYWHLPQIPPRKDLAEIESKKRSMYRKRYQMLDNMAAEMQACFRKT